MKSGTFSLLFAVVFSWFAPLSMAQQSQFDEANTLLENSEYAEAITIYKSIEKDGYISGALWLNMGISYVYLDSLGMGKYYFLKAESFPETQEQASQALGYVHNRFSRQSAVLPELPWMRFLHTIERSVGLSMLMTIMFVFLYIGTMAIIGSWFRVDLRKPLRFSGYVALGFSAIFLLLSSIINYQQSRYGTGVMVERESIVYQNPNEQSATVSTAYEGYTMRVDFVEGEDAEGWRYVRLENGMYGWVKNESLKVF